VVVIVVAFLAVANTVGIDGRPGAQGTAKSLLAVASAAMAPAFAPMGIDAHDWHAPVALLAGIGGKEAILGAFSGLAGQQDAGLGGGSLLATMRRSFGGGPQVYAFLLFVLIYAPCAATITAVARDAGWRFAAAQSAWFTALAWVVATLAYQVAAGRSLVWISVALCSAAALVLVPVAARAGVPRHG
jgi:ferrous iron transport protein B